VCEFARADDHAFYLFLQKQKLACMAHTESPVGQKRAREPEKGGGLLSERVSGHSRFTSSSYTLVRSALRGNVLADLVGWHVFCFLWKFPYIINEGVGEWVSVHHHNKDPNHCGLWARCTYVWRGTFNGGISSCSTLQCPGVCGSYARKRASAPSHSKFVWCGPCRTKPTDSSQKRPSKETFKRDQLCCL
jgi:hypothetical protein